MEIFPPSPVTEIPETYTILLTIFTERVPKTPEPSEAEAFAVIVPGDTEVSSPVELIVACPVPFTTDQTTDLLDAFAGLTAALS